MRGFQGAAKRRRFSCVEAGYFSLEGAKELTDRDVQDLGFKLLRERKELVSRTSPVTPHVRTLDIHTTHTLDTLTLHTEVRGRRRALQKLVGRGTVLRSQECLRHVGSVARKMTSPAFVRSLSDIR